LWQNAQCARRHILLMLGASCGDWRHLPAVRRKYVGISRHPAFQFQPTLGLLWGILVFGELHGAVLPSISKSSAAPSDAGGRRHRVSSASGQEQTRWKDAAIRESDRYGVAADFVEARMTAATAWRIKTFRSALDWLLVALAPACS